MLSITAAQGTADGRRPEASGWQPVSLPDNWSTRWPGYSGTVWYRIDWQRPCPGQMGEPVGLTLESIVMAGEVFVNDELIWRDSHLTEPLSRSWNMPRYWRLPEALVRDGVNTVWVRVVGVAQQTPGLGPVYLGQSRAMQALQEDLWLTNRTLYTLNLIISGVMGALFFCIWIVRREQTTYGWYALMSLFWVLFIANVLLTSPWPFTSTLTAARANSMALVLYTACFCLFTWRFSQQIWPRTERMLWVAAAGLLAMLAFTPDSALPTAQTIGVLTSAGVFLSNCLLFSWHA
ncbi:MAG: sensor histidine kinase, partial [Achromobacter pestifer]